MLRNQQDRLDVLLVLRAPIELYPPSRNQANILASRGLSVGVVNLSSPASTPASLREDVLRWEVHPSWQSKLEARQGLFLRSCNWLRFRSRYRQVVHTLRPRVVIAYDIFGCVFVKPLSKSFVTIFHFHELEKVRPKMGLGARLALHKAMKTARHADLVVVPDHDRANYLHRVAHLPASPTVVMNCALRMDEIPVSPLRTALPGTMQSVCYLGSIGTSQGLIEAAASMRHWPRDTRFVLIGAVSDSVRAQIIEAAKNARCNDRVVFLGARPHDEALALAAGADVGLSLIQPTSENWLYSAGAVNKRFEYMALGLPQITNNGPGVPEIVEGNGCGVCVDPNDPEKIGAAVADLLSDNERRRLMSRNGRRAHLAGLNYETQFQPVAEWISAACREHITLP